jgi:predicted 2-oxoglutarate/Fe(II)-dependent dioxygenase YbiX
MKIITLSPKYEIYRGIDEDFLSKKEELLKMEKINRDNMVDTKRNSLWMEINAEVFRSINDEIKDSITKVTGTPFVNYAEHYWIYTQTKGFNMEWMHRHHLVHPDSRSKVFTDYAFTYYIQQPTNLKGDEGNIVFQDERGVKHSFLPKEGEWFIFPADILHTAIPTPECDIDRIVYAGSLCIDVQKQQEHILKHRI